MAHIIKGEERLKFYLVGNIWGQSLNEPSNFELGLFIQANSHLELFKPPNLLFYLEILWVKRSDL